MIDGADHFYLMCKGFEISFFGKGVFKDFYCIELAILTVSGEFDFSSVSGTEDTENFILV